jgi:hypothetical protein
MLLFSFRLTLLVKETHLFEDCIATSLTATNTVAGAAENLLLRIVIVTSSTAS